MSGSVHEDFYYEMGDKEIMDAMIAQLKQAGTKFNKDIGRFARDRGPDTDARMNRVKRRQEEKMALKAAVLEANFSDPDPEQDVDLETAVGN